MGVSGGFSPSRSRSLDCLFFFLFGPTFIPKRGPSEFLLNCFLTGGWPTLRFLKGGSVSALELLPLVRPLRLSTAAAAHVRHRARIALRSALLPIAANRRRSQTGCAPAGCHGD